MGGASTRIVQEPEAVHLRLKLILVDQKLLYLLCIRTLLTEQPQINILDHERKGTIYSFFINLNE